jgi:hypothetical protein
MRLTRGSRGRQAPFHADWVPLQRKRPSRRVRPKPLSTGSSLNLPVPLFALRVRLSLADVRLGEHGGARSAVGHEAADLDALPEWRIRRDVGKIEGRMGREACDAAHLRVVLLED